MAWGLVVKVQEGVAVRVEEEVEAECRVTAPEQVQVVTAFASIVGQELRIRQESRVIQYVALSVGHKWLENSPHDNLYCQW